MLGPQLFGLRLGGGIVFGRIPTSFGPSRRFDLKAMKIGGTNPNRPTTFAGAKTSQAAVAAEVIDRIHAHAQPLCGLSDCQGLGVGLSIARQYGCQSENSRGWPVKSLGLKTAT